MEAEIMLGTLIIIRIITLSGEQIAVHGLGKGERSALPTMAIAFFGAALLLWIVAIAHGQRIWIGSTLWTGVLYAIAFGLYTTSLQEGPVGSVSPWTNATIILLWLIQPTEDLLSVGGILIFSYGAWLLISRKITRPVILMILSDLFLVMARLLDVSNSHLPAFAYSASLFTSISLWMSIPVALYGQLFPAIRLLRIRPAWSITAASTNAFSYITLFALLEWLPPALVEAISALSGFAATIIGITIFHESRGRRNIWGSGLMTLGVLLLLLDHYHSVILD